MRDKLEKMMGMATSNLEKSQVQQKTWYDQKAREREFQSGDLVLLLLPTSTSKLLAQWQGPYRAVKWTMKIDMPHRRKKRQIFHVNLLNKWGSSSVPSCVASEVEEEENEFPE
jgi:hypothetical protein